MTKLSFHLLIVALIAASCGGDAAPASVTTSAAGAAPTTAPQAPQAAMAESDYYTSVVNALAEVVPLRDDCFEQLVPVATSFDPEGEPGPEPPSLDVETRRRLLTECFVGVYDQATEKIAALAAPEAVQSAHDEHVSARRAVSTLLLAGIEKIESDEDLTPLITSADYLAAVDAEIAACTRLQSEAARFGLVVTLPCGIEDEPSNEPQPEEQVLALIEDHGWVLEPPGSIDTGAGVALMIQNLDAVPHRPAVATLFSGDPDRLPVVDGLVDLGESGVIIDAAAPSDRGYFGLMWPEVTGEGFTGPVPELAPQDSFSIVVRDGVYVLWDHLPDAYESGAFTVLVVTSQQALTATYIDGPHAATSCEELGPVIGDLYAAYADEVRFIGAEDFADSPLAMIDDVRFGAALQRIGALGCDAAQVEADATAAFCPNEFPAGSAARAVHERICGGG